MVLVVFRTPRKRARVPSQKLKDILDSIKAANWTLSDFFFYLFRLEEKRDGHEPQPVVQDSQHTQMLTALLNGTSKPCFGVIINLIHRNSGHVDYRRGDRTSMEKVFQPGILPEDIEHAKPALTVWAVQLVADLVRVEGQKTVACICVQGRRQVMSACGSHTQTVQLGML